MLSSLRRVLCRDDELNTGQSDCKIHYDGRPFRSDNYHVIPSNYDSFLRTISPNPVLSTQTATRTQSQNYSTCFDFSQRSNSILKHTLPRIHNKDPEKTPVIPTNVILKSTSSSACLLFSPPPSPELGSSSFSPYSAFSSIPKSPSVSTKPILAHFESTPTSYQTKTQRNELEKALTPICVIRDDNKDLIRKNIVSGVLKKPLSPQPCKDYHAAPLCADNYYLEVPAKRSLADYLTESGPRLVSFYGSTELYPTDEARCIIQGLVTAILNLKKDKRKHKYLKNPENLILDNKEYHPYSNYVRDLATGHVLRNRKILEHAGKDLPTTIKVTLEKNRMHLKSDDLAALRYLIFEVILVLDHDKKPLLPAEWKSFKKLFSNTKPDYALMSSHPCLWGHTKRLGFYFALDKWRNPSKSDKWVRDLVDDSLSSMRIFQTNWVKKIKRDSHLLKFTGKMTRSRQRKVFGLIRFFRNLVEHCPDKVSASSPYKKESYLDYKLRKLYPNLLEELYQRLLLAGFNY